LRLSMAGARQMRQTASALRSEIAVIHIAVLLRPYLDLMLRGEKTVECRLTRTSRDPFERVEPGERIYFKQSAGPFAASAIVEHALFESNLSPRRVSEIKRDYNHLIKGADEYWRLKRGSEYCSLIWLKDVQAVTSGPAIRPLQGVAWLCLEEEPAWRRVEANDPIQNKGVRPLFREPFAIEITAGNIKNNTLYATSAIERFPEWAIGGASKADAGEPMTLMLLEGPTVQTDIVGGRKLLRTRVWGGWFRKHGAKPGDRVIFTPMNEATYFVGLARGG
jgi:ASC-1-like (ASCH) protein